MIEFVVRLLLLLIVTFPSNDAEGEIIVVVPVGSVNALLLKVP